MHQILPGLVPCVRCGRFRSPLHEFCCCYWYASIIFEIFNILYIYTSSIQGQAVWPQDPKGIVGEAYLPGIHKRVVLDVLCLSNLLLCFPCVAILRARYMMLPKLRHFFHGAQVR